LQAREAGGDFFDWAALQPEGGEPYLHVLLADVMGKGLSASLIAAEMRAVLRTHFRYAEGMEVAVNRTADTTAGDLEANGRFVTLWVGGIDPRTGDVEYVDVGHGLGVIAGPRGVRRLVQNQLPFGVLPGTVWVPAHDRLAPDEWLVVVSDGVYDVFGSIEAALVAVQSLGDAASCAEAVERIIAYAAARGTTDDVTAVVVRRVPLVEPRRNRAPVVEQARSAVRRNPGRSMEGDQWTLTKSTQPDT
jgi:serine phosphatase RsbU (regulator of sigma subunit)